MRVWKLLFGHVLAVKGARRSFPQSKSARDTLQQWEVRRLSFVYTEPCSSGTRGRPRSTAPSTGSRSKTRVASTQAAVQRERQKFGGPPPQSRNIRRVSSR